MVEGEGYLGQQQVQREGEEAERQEAACEERHADWAASSVQQGRYREESERYRRTGIVVRQSEQHTPALERREVLATAMSLVWRQLQTLPGWCKFHWSCHLEPYVNIILTIFLRRLTSTSAIQVRIVATGEDK